MDFLRGSSDAACDSTSFDEADEVSGGAAFRGSCETSTTTQSKNQSTKQSGKLSEPKSFSKEHRLLRSWEFRRLAKRGSQKAGKNIVVHYLLEQNSLQKLGLTVSKRYGKAYERNLFKRRLREAFRLLKEKLPKGLLLNVRPLWRAKSAKTQDLQKDLIKIFAKYDKSV